MNFAIKAEVSDVRAKTFVFNAEKTMYAGKQIAKGDTIFIFASENEGGPGLIASGVVSAVEAIAKKPGIARQTPRVSITDQTQRAGEETPGAERTQAFFRLEGQPTRDRTQFQILSPGNEQDRRHLG